MPAQDIVDCCKVVNPCDAVCLLNNVLIDLVAGRAVTSYRVGEESYQLRPPTIAETRGLLEYFEGKCAQATGVPSRRRAKLCFVPGPHRCAGCGFSSCRCR